MQHHLPLGFSFQGHAGTCSGIRQLSRAKGEPQPAAKSEACGVQEKEQLESDLQSMGLMAHEVERPDREVSAISRDRRKIVSHIDRRSEEIRALHDQAAEVLAWDRILRSQGRALGKPSSLRKARAELQLLRGQLQVADCGSRST